MTIKPEEKTKIIKKTAKHEKDTGSAQVQIALLSEQINKLIAHLKKHPKDVHSRRGLIKMVVKRKKLLSWLKKKSEKGYSALIKKLDLSKNK